MQSANSTTVQAPLLQSFDNVAVTEGAPEPGQEVESSAPPLRAKVLSADRANAQLKVKIKVSNPGGAIIASHPLAYQDVYALDPRGKRKYPVLKGQDGTFLAEPLNDRKYGGRWFLSKVEPGGQAFLSLTFQAPPDSVKSVDVVLPWFNPFEATQIAGEGGAAESGVAVAGKSLELERVLKDLNADVTPQEIKVNLSADLLFDFDKTDLKPEAEPSLEKVATVLKANPNSQVTIEGHADGRGQ